MKTQFEYFKFILKIREKSMMDLPDTNLVVSNDEIDRALNLQINDKTVLFL